MFGKRSCSGTDLDYFHVVQEEREGVPLMGVDVANLRRIASGDEADYIPAKIAIVATVSVAIVLSVLLKC
jgi:hypothetical protein